MRQLLLDPVVLICIGIMVAGIIGLFWAIGKFTRKESSLPVMGATDDLYPSASNLRDIDFGAPPIIPPSSAPASVPVSRDVADRLDSMSSRLSEMQSVLMKQSSAAGATAGGAGAGGVGQGFSPETIDKLLKIIGNVIQQVDVLQKSINVTKDGAESKADASLTPLTKI